MFEQHGEMVKQGRRRAMWRAVRRPFIVSLAVMVVFGGGAAIWSVKVPIASAALAPGQISPEGHRKTVQHLEGGIVREIRVRDGDRVSRGEILVVLEETQALAAYRVQQQRLVSLLAMEARLMADQTGASEPNWSRVPEAPGREAAIADQMRIYRAGNDSLLSQSRILTQRKKQLEEEIRGLNAQIASNTQQLALLNDEIGMMQSLTDKGLSRKPRLLELQRTQAEASGMRAKNRAAVARAKQSIGETEMQIQNLRTRRQDDAANRIGDVRAQIADIEERMTATRDVLARTVISAPVNGIVIDMRLKTAGGVLRPGEPVMDIVPDGDDLLVDARVSPNDIDVVAPGLEAAVTLTAFPQRNLPKLTGHVRQVSADRMSDPLTGEPYFLARIEIDRQGLLALGGGVELVPGMPADTMIFTGARTFIEYLIDPLVQSIDRSFREN